MPGIVAHMVVAKLVGKKLQLNSNEFILGNIMPDIISSKDSHHKIQGKIYLIPDIKYWVDKLDLSNNSDLGYFTHLLLDWHFLEEYIPNNIDNKNAFIDKTMYSDYDLLNGKLVKRFNLDLESINKALSNAQINKVVDKDRLSYNIECLSIEKEGETRNLDEESFSQFLFTISEKISKEIEEYASKPSVLSICTRQREKRKYKKK